MVKASDIRNGEKYTNIENLSIEGDFLQIMVDIGFAKKLGISKTPYAQLRGGNAHSLIQFYSHLK